MAKEPTRSLSELADDLEEAFLAYAYAAYASAISDAAKTTFKAFFE